MAMAQKTGIPKWETLVSRDMETKTCGLIFLINFEPHHMGGVKIKGIGPQVLVQLFSIYLACMLGIYVRLTANNFATSNREGTCVNPLLSKHPKWRGHGRIAEPRNPLNPESYPKPPQSLSGQRLLSFQLLGKNKAILFVAGYPPFFPFLWIRRRTKKNTILGGPVQPKQRRSNTHPHHKKRQLVKTATSSFNARGLWLILRMVTKSHDQNQSVSKWSTQTQCKALQRRPHLSLDGTVPYQPVLKCS